MFRTKKDVERHVSDVLSKINSENEKNLRGYTFARLFFQVKDYEAAKKHLSSFLSIRDYHAPAHKLMAQIYEATNNAENALQSYKRSLEIDSHQTDIVLKICELYCQLSVDHDTARYWADRAEQLFPHNEIVFKLRECMVSAEGEPDHQELENLIATELVAQPKNSGLRIRLLRLYLDTERVKEAYDHAMLIESKILFPYSVEWYYLLGDIFEAYQEEFGQNLDFQFYMHYLTALDCLISLTLAEPHSISCENGKKQYSVNDAAAVLLTFDQILKKACEKETKEESWTYFIHHMKGQLYFYMTSLLLKRAKLDQGNRKEALRFSAGLAVVCYTFKPMNLLQEIWFSHLEDNQKAFTKFFQQGSLRTSFIGHVITDICKEDKSKWLQKLKLEICISQVKERIYSRIFSSVVEKDKLLSSYFILDTTFENCSLEYPSEVALQEYDAVAYKLCPNSLHHLVWLELHRRTASGLKFDDTLSEVFKGLQYSNKNLSKGSCESLCVLDLKAYLYASVYQAQCSIEKKRAYLLPRTQESQLSYPPDIADAMCTRQQASWWRAAYGLHTSTIKEKLGESRRELQHGLEVIRGVGIHGMEVQLVVHLAQMFADKADFLIKGQKNSDDKKKKIKSDKVAALQMRAIHYWNIALGMLKNISSGQSPRAPKEQTFVVFSKALSNDEVKTLQEDGQLYIAVYLMDSGKLDEAAELLSKLSTPYGSYYLALTLKQLAAQEENFSNTKAVLLSKAKNSVHETMDRIKDDKKHPLNKEIYLVLEDIETELATNLSMNNSQNNEDLDEIDTYASPEVNNSLYVTPNSHKSVMHSTPRPSAQFMATKSRTQLTNPSSHKHFEPSPERLDAQIRALSLNQDTIVKTLMEQQKSIIETKATFMDTMKQNTEVLEQLKKLLEDLKISDRNQPRGTNRKHSYGKGQGDEEDYTDYDPNGLLEFYAEEGNEDYRNPGYSYNSSSRMVQEAAASLNYVMSPAIPPGPPPALNPYNYHQYPPHTVLPAPPVAERPPFYPPPGQGLPFSEGQQLPQFQFHVATPVVKHPPPVMSNVANMPQAVTLPPPPVGLRPPQSVIPPPSAPLSMPNPWSKTGVPHAFQIPLPSPTPFSAPAGIVPQSAPAMATNSVVSSQSQLKNLLRTPPAQVVMSPFGHTLQTISTPPTSLAANNLSIFAGISKTPEFNKIERARCDSENAGSPDNDGDLEREVMGDFKPLIPLPAEIVVETGEENEVVLFEDRAKLYRFVDQEWKERGIGIVKILHHVGSGRVRLLMRRDQVLKVCANHYISSNMEVNPLKSSDRAWTWVAQDFADEELRPEHFCIRFKTSELASAYKAAFDKAINISKEAEPKKFASPKLSVTDSSSVPKPFGAKFLPKAGSWSCPTCYIINVADKLLCVACETKKPVLQDISVSTTASATTTTMGTSPAAVSPVVQNPILSFKATSNENKFEFSTPVSFQSSKFSSNAASVSAPGAAKNVFGGFTFSSSPMIREADDPEIKDREILVVSTKAKNGPQVTKVNQINSSPFSGFSFVKSPPPATSSLTVQLSGDSRNVTTVLSEKTTSFEGFSSTKPTSTTNYANMPSSIVNSTGPSENLSKLQSMVQSIKPTFVFEPKGSPKIADVLSPNELSSGLPTTSGSTLVPSSSVSTNRLTDGSPEEFIPTAEFKPVVPLPALVDVQTGEEGEEKLFEERAKIFRFDANSKEWKERGTGKMKILYLKDSHKYRILMRRDQVLKICANHYILPEMKLTPLAKGDKAWVWFAQDFSEGDLIQEQFAAKFKTADIAKKFYDVFQKCQAKLKSSSSENTADKCTGNSTSFDQLFKPASNAWECFNCHKSNMNASACVYCKTPKDSNTKSMSKPQGNEQKPLSELFKPDIGTWECQCCYVWNKSADSKCASCESPNPSSTKSQKETLVQDQVKQSNSSVSSTLNKNESFANLFKPQPGSWECQSCLVRNSADKTKCLSCETDKTDSSTTNSSIVFEKFKYGSSDSSTMPAFSFGKPKTGGEFVFGMRPVTQPTTFSFGHSTVSNKENETVGFMPSLPSTNVPAVFGGETQKSLSEKNSLPVNIEQTSLFGSSTPTKFNFGSGTPSQQSDSEPLGFKFGSPQKYEFNFTGVRPRSPVKTPKSPRSPAAPSDVEEEDEEDSDVDNIYFQPAIPLPPKVEVKTGEEDEKVIFCKRAKLFRFSSGEWKERGLGDIKILLDENTNRARLLMRREQVLKVCLNHYLTKEIAFESRGDKSLSWAVTDFSENEPSPELLAVRFKTSELAEEFKEALADALKRTNELSIPPLPPTDITPAKSASTFSFKTDIPIKVETNFSSGLLSSRFGTNVQDKSTFGDSTKTGFSFTDSKESPQASSLFSFSFKNKSASSTFFGQPSNFGNTNADTVLGEELSAGTQPQELVPDNDGQLKETIQESDDDIKIIYEATAPPNKIAEAEILKLPKNFYLYESKESCPGCRGCSDTIPLHKGTVVDEPVEKTVDEVLHPVVNVSQEEVPSNTVDANAAFCSSKFNTLSFTELASNSSFQDITKSSPSGKPFAGAGTPLFSNLNTSTEDGSDEVSQGPDIHFEPVIPLPDLIEVKTGEEDETPVFVHRAKLFRYDPNTKQWKERGVGDIKILRHKEKLRFRIILRRDQVHNVACNHCITEDMSLSPLATSDTALCWTALDFSDGKEEPTQFAIRFKHKAQMNEFREVFNECQMMLKDCKEDFVQENDAAGATPSQTKPEDTEESASTTTPTVTVPAELNHNVEGEADESNSEGGSEEEDVDVLFEKRASLEIFDEAEGKFKSEGLGTLKIIYDDGVFGYHITMNNDNGKILCDHIIAVQTCIRTEGKMATWAAIDAAAEPVTRRQFRARFSSKEALMEFNKYFEEGKEIALQSGIVEKCD